MDNIRVIDALFFRSFVIYRYWHWNETLTLTLTLPLHTHTHTLSIAPPPPPPPPSLSFFRSFPPFLPPLSFVRSYVAIIRINHSYTHTPDHPSNNQLIDKRSFLPSFVLSIDRWVNTLSSIDRSITHTLNYYYYWLPAVHCVCVYACVWCELIAL